MSAAALQALIRKHRAQIEQAWRAGLDEAAAELRAQGLLNRRHRMTGEDLHRARRKLGEAWLGRPLTMTELGRVLGLAGEDPGVTVRDYERGKKPISGPITLAIALMLAGAKPADLERRLAG